MGQYIVGTQQALGILLTGQERQEARLGQQQAQLDALCGRVVELQGAIMALTDRETQAVAGISDTLDQMRADIDAAFDAATKVNTTLRDKITALQAQDGADQAQIADLQALQAQMEQDVLGALGGVQDKATATDDHVKTLTPPAPPTP